MRLAFPWHLILTSFSHDRHQQQRSGNWYDEIQEKEKRVFGKKRAGTMISWMKDDKTKVSCPVQRENQGTGCVFYFLLHFTDHQNKVREEDSKTRRTSITKRERKTDLHEVKGSEWCSWSLIDLILTGVSIFCKKKKEKKEKEKRNKGRKAKNDFCSLSSFFLPSLLLSSLRVILFFVSCVEGTFYSGDLLAFIFKVLSLHQEIL